MAGEESFVNDNYRMGVPHMHQSDNWDLATALYNLTLWIERDEIIIGDKPIHIIVVPYRNRTHLETIIKNYNKFDSDIIMDKQETENSTPDITIVWRIIKEQPVTKNGTVQRTPEYQTLYKDNLNQQAILKYGWEIECLVGWTILTKSQHDYLYVSKWFRTFMLNVAKILNIMGIQRCYWEGTDVGLELGYEKPFNDAIEEVYYFRYELPCFEKQALMNKLIANMEIDLNEKEKYKEYISRYIQSVRNKQQ